MSGSGYKVPLTIIKEIRVHPNADRLEIAIVYGFEVVIVKEQYKVGDEVIYIPIDSVIPQKLEDQLFTPDSKIKLNKRRVRQIRIRKFPSQGMLIPTNDISAVYHIKRFELEADYADKLEIVKYEPPTKHQGAKFGVTKKIKKFENGWFKKYGGVENIKWYPEKFKNDEIVVVTEKIHGTNARAGILPYVANTWWRKILKFFGQTPKWEQCYGSNNVQLQDRKKYKGFYGEDIYGRVFGFMDVFSKLDPGESVYGEIYGFGVQKNYNYGCKEGEHHFVLFDVRITCTDGKFRWLDPDEMVDFAKDRGFNVVPELYRGPFDLELMRKLTVGNSVLAPTQKVREGIVIRPERDYDQGMGSKKALKFISEKYLDKEQTEFS